MLSFIPAISHSDLKVIRQTSMLILLVACLYHYYRYTQIDFEASGGSTIPQNYITTTSSSNTKARIQSYGFFFDSDISDADWELYRERVRTQERHPDGNVLNQGLYVNNFVRSGTRTFGAVGGFRNNGEYGSEAHLFYSGHYDAEFTCPNEVQIGGGGSGRPTAKWLCDPHRILSSARRRKMNEGSFDTYSAGGSSGGKNGCLVYIFLEVEKDLTSSMKLHLIKDLQNALTSGNIGDGYQSRQEQEMDQCEIHIFYPTNMQDEMDENQKKNTIHDDMNILLQQQSQSTISMTPPASEIIPNNKNIHVHPWGLEADDDVHQGRRNYMTLEETVRRLGHYRHGRHSGFTVDVLIIDCGGCEWSVYRDFHNVMMNEGVAFTQILMQLHGAPQVTNDFFSEMRRNGYVIFHKDVAPVPAIVNKDDNHGDVTVLVDGVGSDEGGSNLRVGENHEYSFLRLAPEFFKWEN